jgi:hypothetical protein
MAAKFCAVWLVVLIVLPFTAPFTTCEQMNAVGFSAARDEAAIAETPVIQDDDAIVSSEWTLPIERSDLFTVAGGGFGLSVTLLAQTSPRSFEPQPLIVNVRSSAILRI